MRTFILASALVALMVPASMLMAQDKPTAPAAAASMPMDCGNAKRHDHAAEKGMPLAKAKPCEPAQAASAAKAKPAHDHGKVHKQQ